MNDDDDEKGRFLRHTSCDQCGSSDARAEYSNDTSYCFSCQAWGKTDGSDSNPPQKRKATAMTDFIRGEYRDLPKRGLREDTLRKFGYGLAATSSGPVHVANYKKDGELVAQKIRTTDKSFRCIGNPSSAGFFGQHLWREGGKMLIITEGEIDAMSAYQAMGSKWPVVSLPQGAQSAEKVFKQELSWLESYEKIVLCFDEDEPGREAVSKVAPLIEPGKVVVTSLPKKDANECITEGQTQGLVSAIWDAHPYRPDGVLDASELWDLVSTTETFDSVPFPFQGLNDMTHGLRKGELVTICSGSGMGKSSIVREILFDLVQRGYKCGGLFLEESVKRTALGLMGLAINKPLHLNHVAETVPKEELREAFEATAGTGRLMLYDHFGSSQIDMIMDKIKFMAANGCDFIFLDHISMVVSGLETTDERKLIDVMMTKLRTLVSRFNIGLIAVSHLKRPDGVALENGRAIDLSLLRGSSSIAQLSDSCLGLERDQQADRPEDRNKTKIRVLKNRYSGETGVCAHLTYSPATGRLTEDRGPSITPISTDMPTQNSSHDDDLPF